MHGRQYVIRAALCYDTGVDADAAFEREVLRIYRRYQREVVEALRLCPWAERARADGRVRERVIATAALDALGALGALDALAADPKVDIGLLIFPRVRASRGDFERFVEEVRRADAGRGAAASDFRAAVFHPDAAADLASPARLLPFIRRSPDPTIQLVRAAALDRVRGDEDEARVLDSSRVHVATFLSEKPGAPLHERVADLNHQTIRELGVAAVEAILDDIRRDRDRAYAAFGA